MNTQKININENIYFLIIEQEVMSVHELACFNAKMYIFN